MEFQRWTAPVWIGACALALCAGVLTSMEAQQAGRGAGRGGGRGGSAMNVFAAVDANKDGS